MEKILILSFLLIILCLIIRKLACKGETNLGNDLKLIEMLFKNDLKSSNSWLSSWRGLDCCQWEGIDYENKTRAIILVDLIKHILPRKHMRMGPLQPCVERLDFH